MFVLWAEFILYESGVYDLCMFLGGAYDSCLFYGWSLYFMKAEFIMYVCFWAELMIHVCFMGGVYTL